MLFGLTPEDVLLAYGPLGILSLVGLLLGRRLVNELDELKSERKDMLITFLEVIPLMKHSTELHEKRQAADELSRGQLDGFRQNQVEMREELREIRRRLESR